MNPAPPDRRHRLVVLAVCCAGLLVVTMDNTIVTVALPAIRADLHASLSGLQWTVDAYTLVLAGFLMLAGSTADRVGRRRVFQVGMASFGVGSLICSLAPNTGALIGARAVQALGGSMLSPVAMAIVANTFTDRRERARAIGVYGSMAGLSLVAGPIVGGALVDWVGWRAVFWINVPIAVAAVVCAARFVPESRAPRPRRFDPVGQLLVLAALAALVYVIIEFRELGWTSPVTVGLLGVVVAAVAGLLYWEPRRADPLLELRFFRSPPFSAAVAIAVAGLCGFGAFLFLTTLYLQQVRGYSAVATGLCLLPIGVLVVVCAPLTGRVVGSRGPRLPLLVAGGSLAVAGLIATGLGADTPLPALLAAYLPFGVFMGTINPPITNTAVSGMPVEMAGVAASVASSCRQVGITLGVAVAGAVAGAAAAHGGPAFVDATRPVWWLVCGLGLAIVALGLIGTSGHVGEHVFE